jgi:hypothetical protein
MMTSFDEITSSRSLFLITAAECYSRHTRTHHHERVLRNEAAEHDRTCLVILYHTDLRIFLFEVEVPSSPIHHQILVSQRNRYQIRTSNQANTLPTVAVPLLLRDDQESKTLPFVGFRRSCVKGTSLLSSVFLVVGDRRSLRMDPERALSS